MHEPLVHVVPVDNIIRVKFWFVQHCLNEILDILHTHPLQVLVIRQDALALDESVVVLFPLREYPAEANSLHIDYSKSY
jgi:hypothetical protein